MVVPFGGNLTAEKWRMQRWGQGNSRRKGSAQGAMRTQTAVVFSSLIQSNLDFLSPLLPSLHLCPPLQEESMFTGPSLFNLVLIHH